jgi:dynein heavy chain
MMEVLQLEVAKATEQQKTVAKDEIEAKKQQDEAQRLAAEAEAAVAKANDELELTLQKVK